MYIVSFSIGFVLLDTLLKYTRLNRGRYFTCNAIGTLVISCCTFSQAWNLVSLQECLNQEQPIIAIDVAFALIFYQVLEVKTCKVMYSTS